MHRATRSALRVGMPLFGAVALAIPPLIVGLSGAATADVLWTALRIAALEAFTLLFANIVTGAFRPIFNQAFGARLVHRIHLVTGISGLSLAIAHGVMALVFGIAGYLPAPLWVGPAALALLALVVGTALARRRFRSSWRRIHRLNYLIFVAILIHGLFIGYDLRSDIFLKVWFALYAAVTVAGYVFRTLRAPGGAKVSSR